MTRCIFLFLFYFPIWSFSQIDTLFVYGPGGPYAPIKECAGIFNSSNNNFFVKIIAGPENKWIVKAKNNADIIYGGSEYMFTSFSKKYPDILDLETRQELYKRRAAILVRPGNPKNIKSIKDLGRKGIHILDVNGAGQLGLWEDISGKEDMIGQIQNNIYQSFDNTALGIEEWKKDSIYDAWITYLSWHYRLSKETQIVEIPSNINVYRGTPIALTKAGKNKKCAQKFVEFLRTEQSHHIFQKWGWE